MLIKKISIFFILTLVITSCCKQGEDCKELMLLNWIKTITEPSMRFESNQGNWVILYVGKLDTDLQGGSSCEAEFSTSCECICESSYSLNTFTSRSSTALSDNLRFYENLIDQTSDNNLTRVFKVMTSRSKYESNKPFFESDLNTIANYIDSNKAKDYGSVFEINFNISTEKELINKVFLSKEYGIAGFTTTENETFYLQ